MGIIKRRKQTTLVEFSAQAFMVAAILDCDLHSEINAGINKMDAEKLIIIVNLIITNGR